MNIDGINTSPTDGQKIAGNYRKGHLRVHGLDITIENPAGSYRVGVGSNGKKWRAKLPNHYGYIRGTAGADGDHVDVYLGRHLKAPKVFIIDQYDLGGGDFDEHKCFIGFGSQKQAEEAYCRAFSDGRGKARIGHVTSMDVGKFKEWLRSGRTRHAIKRRAEGGAVYDTRLGPADELAYGAWKKLHAPTDSGEDYDLRGAYLSGEVQAPDGHMTDRYKKPNHPTFSDQSQYATGDQRERAGHWAGDTFVPPDAMRAGGGGVQDGPPPFEMTSEAPSFDQTEEPKRPPGMMEAAGYGAASGATFNMADEMAGAHAAGPSGLSHIPRTIAGAASAALTDKGSADYTKGRDEYRAGEKAAEEAHPWVHTGAEIAGAIPAMATMPEAGFARLPKYGRGLAKAAQTAAEYGGLSGAGEGEGVADRALKGATGIVTGIVGGPVGKLAGDAIGAGIQKFGAPVAQTVRGWIDKDGEAARRAGLALRADQELIASGKATGLTPQQWVAARQAGEPVTLADLGSANTQSLLRSAANTSPEARAQLEQVIQSRFLTQTERVADTVQRAIPGSQGNARKTADELIAHYDQGRTPAYAKAYADGDKEIISPAIERLTGSDIFSGAMRRAISSGKDRAVAMEGLGAFNPAINIGPGGAFIFNKTKPNGGPVYPNLQYWDQVKRELDDVATKAFKSGAKGEGEVASKMAKILRGELDAQVPSYKNARGMAEQFFGESNALEAGRKLAGKKPVAEDVKAILRQMKPDERTLFQEGYASDLAERVIGRMKDTQDVTKAMFNSPNERKLAAAVFGPGGMAMLQARMSLETIMDGARQAMGNSTTARQLIEAGLAGGALSGYASGWDPTETLKGAGAFATARGAPAVIGKVLPQVADSARHMIGKVDAKTAAKVAELLTSSDPRLLRQGYQMAAKSEAIMSRLKAMANRVTLSGQAQTRNPVEQGFRALQGPVGARADEDQQRP